MNRTAETVIVGGGIIGLCTALQLARRDAGRIVVLDKGAGPGEGSTGASSAVCRAKYSIDSTVVLARDGIAAYRNWREFLELRDPLACLHEEGVVWLSDGRTDWPAAEADRLSSLGVAAEVLDDASLAARFPAINPCVTAPDLVTAEPHRCGGGGLHLIETNGGYVDPVDALQDLIRSVRARGVEVRFGSHVVSVAVVGGGVSGVSLANGDRIACDSLVNAAGPWCADIFAMSGLPNPWPLVPTRIQIVHIDRPVAVRGRVPACADPLGGIYFRSQNRGQQIIVGSVLEEDECETVGDPDYFDRGVDEQFTATKLYALQHRIRGLDNVRTAKGYSGLYTMNRCDVHPIVGATPLCGFYVANGFSGHGFKLAPAIGSLLAQALGGSAAMFDTHVDPAFLAFDRKPIAVATRSVLA